MRAARLAKLQQGLRTLGSCLNAASQAPEWPFDTLVASIVYADLRWSFMHIFLYEHLHIDVYIYLYIYMYMCIYIYIHTYAFMYVS